MTNADRIRQMTDEELWVLMFKIQRCDYCRFVADCEMTDEECKKIGVEWLKSECEEELLTEIPYLGRGKKADEARQESEENPEEVYEQEMNDFVRDEIDRFEPGLDGM